MKQLYYIVSDINVVDEPEARGSPQDGVITTEPSEYPQGEQPSERNLAPEMDFGRMRRIEGRGGPNVPQNCKFCKKPATKALIWCEHHAYVPCCDAHIQDGKDSIGDNEGLTEIEDIVDIPHKKAYSDTNVLPDGSGFAVGTVPSKSSEMNEFVTEIFESIGEASLCWDPKPEGVFDEQHAIDVAERLIQIVNASEDAPVAVREWNGVDLVIEWPKGSTRKGTGKDGKKWEREMFADYGFIKDTTSEDGEGVDVYVGDDKDSDLVWVVHQMKDGKFDEDKVMIDAGSGAQAEALYRKHYPNNGKDQFGGIDDYTVDEFMTEYLAKYMNKKPKYEVAARLLRQAHIDGTLIELNGELLVMWRPVSVRQWLQQMGLPGSAARSTPQGRVFKRTPQELLANPLAYGVTFDVAQRLRKLEPQDDVLVILADPALHKWEQNIRDMVGHGAMEVVTKYSPHNIRVGQLGDDIHPGSFVLSKVDEPDDGITLGQRGQVIDSDGDVVMVEMPSGICQMYRDDIALEALRLYPTTDEMRTDTYHDDNTGEGERIGDVEAPYSDGAGPLGVHEDDKDTNMVVHASAAYPIGEGLDPYLIGDLYTYNQLTPQHQHEVDNNWDKNIGRKFMWRRAYMPTNTIVSESKIWYDFNRNKKWEHADKERVLAIAERINDGAILTPLMVSPVGEKNGGLWEGYHRLRAAEILGLSELPVIVKIDPSTKDYFEMTATEPSESELDMEAVADNGDNLPDAYTNVDGNRQDLAIDRDPATEHMKY